MKNKLKSNSNKLNSISFAFVFPPPWKLSRSTWSVFVERNRSTVMLEKMWGNPLKLSIKVGYHTCSKAFFCGKKWFLANISTPSTASLWGVQQRRVLIMQLWRSERMKVLNIPVSGHQMWQWASIKSRTRWASKWRWAATQVISAVTFFLFAMERVKLAALSLQKVPKVIRRGCRRLEF